ncbi:mediator of RNA polymerase II transcription subunit 10 [Trichodelitschia bisporula]|uniref:Mediator of RNA polymerase II transcription subunit 10 n=1 Tax=Trichodelitschia bisporula TaxID=703511 RepID=A0A6G1I6L6_9PEZI|nr:mediator of RNA polymerase II transcription subunit 10 [Trichodelitschia bisporula]
MAQATLAQVDDQMKSVTQNLYNLIVQALEHQGAPTEAAMKREITDLANNLAALEETVPNLQFTIPPEVIEYVQEGRNPDIYTREFVELVMKQNQKLKGKTEAFAQFRDVLAKELISAVPEIKDDVVRVVESTGGVMD